MQIKFKDFCIFRMQGCPYAFSHGMQNNSNNNKIFYPSIIVIAKKNRKIIARRVRRLFGWDSINLL